MSVSTVQPVPPYSTCQAMRGPDSYQLQLEEGPVTKVLTKSDFPSELVAAVGEENLAKMPQVTIKGEHTSYLDGHLSLDMIPDSGAIKGTNHDGCVFIAFAVVNPRYKEITQAAGFGRYPAEEVALFTVFQNHKGDAAFSHRWCETIPTNDPRFCRGDTMSDEKYAAIKEVFDGRHRDLILGGHKEIVKQRKDLLRGLGLSEEDARKKELEKHQ
ncbi:MAG TPA: hypothetical protein VLF94_04350, partial [Chlamydiales bacterium]|nr:hypothetical protein [Chlamydiales bacterium]